MGTARWVAAVAAVALWAPEARGESLTSEGGFLFDVDATGGTLINGTRDAWDGCYALEVDGTGFRASGPAQTSGRTVWLPPMKVGQLSVTRTIHVPGEPGRDYARYVDVIRNGSSSSLTVGVRYTGNLGSDGSTQVYRTASGDRGVDPSDRWFGTDDVDGGGDPSLVHVFFGASSRLRPSVQRLSGDDIEVVFRLDLGPGEVVALMVFAFQAPSQAEALRQVAALERDLDSAVRDLSPLDTEHIANFSVHGSGYRSLLDAPLPEADEETFGEGDEPLAIDSGLPPAAPAPSPRRPPIAAARPRDLAYRAQVRIATRDVSDRIARVEEIAEELGGHLVERRDEAVVIRVPAPRFREALERVEALGDVLQRRIMVREVTERVRDLRVRLRTATEVRDRLRALLRRTESVEESLAVQRELERLSREIELLTAELESLEREVRYSSIAIYFQPIGVHREVPVARFALPFEWLDRLGLDRLLRVR